MEPHVTPHLTAEEVVAIAKQVLHPDLWPYDESQGLRPKWRGVDTGVPGREGEAMHLWNVGFTTPLGPFDQVDRFLIIDDRTGKPLHILLGPGRYDF